MSSFHEPVLISFETYFLSRPLFSADQCRCCFHDEIASKFTAVGKNNKSKMKSLLVSIIKEANTPEVTRGNKRRTNTQGALTIYTIHPGGNFRCKYSVLQLFQTENGKIKKCIGINWKVQKERKKCID